MKVMQHLTSLLFLSSIVNVFATDSQCPDPLIYNTTNNDRRDDKSKLTIMQYNVEWLFLDYYGAADCPGDGCSWKNESEAETHMQYVSDVIDTINPDIINFCEIEGCDELHALQETLLGLDYNPYLIKGTDTATGQNVGMLARIDPVDSLNRTEIKYDYPIENSHCGYTGNGTTGVSKHYISHFFINNIKIAIISAHLIAFPTDKTRCSKREAQASILQRVIYEHIQEGYEIIMMGDFNDFDNSVEDINRDEPISMVLDVLKGNQGELKGKYLLTSVATKIPQFMRFTDWYDSDNDCNTYSIHDYSMIDHILVTPMLYRTIEKTTIYHGYKEYCGKMNSDHYPIIVEFDLDIYDDFRFGK